MSTPIIIDTDPGIDDAIALALAAASPEVEILGITAVSGNVGIEKTAANAAALADFLQLDCPVGEGASRPLVKEPSAGARSVHGESGLGTLILPPSARRLQPAAPLMAELICSSEQRVTVVAVGPLTNISTLLTQYPRAASLVERFVIMGGGTGYRTGNVTAGAEFNIHYDPRAAGHVFTSGMPVTMVGLNVTERALVGPAHLPALFGSGGPLASAVGQLMSSYGSRPTADGRAQHDALALAAVIAPSLVKTEKRNVEVVAEPGPAEGMTLVDWRESSSAEKNTDVAVDLDVAGFRALMDSRLATLDTHLARAL